MSHPAQPAVEPQVETPAPVPVAAPAPAVQPAPAPPAPAPPSPLRSSPGRSPGTEAAENDGSAPDERTDDADEAAVARDWRWIEEWREGGEETPWAYGVGLAAFAALVAMVGVVALAGSLSGQPWLAVIVNAVVAAGLAPALWLCRGLPVLRWVAAGVAAGVLLGWIGSLAVVPAA